MITAAEYKKVITGLQVLVVDDEPEIREIIGDDFALCGGHVQSAANGEDAYNKWLSALGSKPFDIIVSDVRMPQWDGVQFLSKVKAECRDKKLKAPLFIMVSGFSDYPQEDVLKLGAAALMSKPFQLQELRNAVATHLKAR